MTRDSEEAETYFLFFLLLLTFLAVFPSVAWGLFAGPKAVNLSHIWGTFSSVLPSLPDPEVYPGSIVATNEEFVGLSQKYLHLYLLPFTVILLY